MRVIVLGAAAGGGFPQWNCRCDNCRLAWAADPRARPRTQCAVAVSADGWHWLLLNAPPDLRQQILATPALHPRQHLRDSPIEAVLLTGGDVDACAGLLNLREGQPFDLLAAAPTLGALESDPVFAVLDREHVRRIGLRFEETYDLGFGLGVEIYPVPGKAPLWLEERSGPLDLASEAGEAIGVHITAASGASFHFVPGCARLSPDLRARLRGAPLVLFDGTLFDDEEMRRAGAGTKTGRRMGHMSMAGEHGSMAALMGLDIARKVYVHINNTNPVLIDGSPERRTVEAAGFEIAWDGMEIQLP